MIRKWFFTLSESSISRKDHGWRGLIRVAVKSAVLNTDLSPHLIYDGAENSFISELRSLGVTVVPHRVSFYQHLLKKDCVSPGYLPICSAVFLRVELPLLEQEDEFVLYADCDVMFLRNPNLTGIRPKTFASAPQSSLLDYRNDINTGVMVMNLPALRRDLPQFTRFIIEHLNDGWPGCDQENYRRFYNGNWSPLPLEMNWKPYWGENDEAVIVHWHGPKPALVRLLREQPDLSINASWTELFRRNEEGYAYFLNKWDALAAGNARSVVGHLDLMSTKEMAGWAVYEDAPNEPVRFLLWVDGKQIGEIACTARRRDLESLYHVDIGGFFCSLPALVNDGRPHTLSITDAAGRPLEIKYQGQYLAQFRVGGLVPSQHSPLLTP